MIRRRPHELLDFFETDYPKAKLTDRTIEEFRSQLRVFDRWFAKVKQPRPAQVGDLSERLLAEAQAARLEAGRPATTANKLCRHVAAVWGYAYKCRLTREPPAWSKVPENRRQRKTWTPDEFQRILTAAARLEGGVGGGGCDGANVAACDFWIALLLTLQISGGRIDAVMQAAPRALDLERNTFKLIAEDQKQKADQTFALSPEARIALARIYDAQRAKLFAWPLDPGDGVWKSLRNHFKRLLRSAGLRHGREDMFHAIRRATGTWIAKERGIEAARDYLGHSHVNVTRAYLDVTQLDTIRDAVSVLPRFEIGNQLSLFRTG